MSVLSVCQEAAIELNQAQPTSLFSNTDKLALELRTQANNAARAISQYYDWQQLTKLATLTGDASATAFDLPDDYDRMPKKAAVHSSSWINANFYPARDLDNWLYLQEENFSGMPGTWIILGGQMQIYPAISATETARFYYISKNYAGPDKPAFTTDADTFVLSEYVLKLGVIWRWRASKRLEYAEDMRNYEIALADEVSKDKGSRLLIVGQQRTPWNLTTAYPRALGS